MSWCTEKLRDIHQRFAAAGQYGSIAVLERFMRSLKQECTLQIRVPQNPDDMRSILSLYLAWYNEFRPHQGLGGRVPMDLCLDIDTRADPIETREKDGVIPSCSSPFSKINAINHLPMVHLDIAT